MSSYQICNVYLPVTFYQPQDQAANVNDNVTFTCGASGDPTNYFWTFNNNDPMNDPEHIEGANSKTLMIIGVSITDGGEYTCTAEYGKTFNATSDPALLYGEV